MRLILAATLMALIASPSPSLAEGEAKPVGITAEAMTVTVPTKDGPVEIGRIQDNANVLTGDWALTSRACPPFCIQPAVPAPGVTTVGELEVLEMLQDSDAVVVDSRTQDWYTGGTIPGAINVPYTQAVERLAELGCQPDFDGKFDCSTAKKAVLFCNGIWCGQSPTAIRAMIEAGYPAERIFYYRGGMQTWRLLGLTVAGGK